MVLTVLLFAFSATMNSIFAQLSLNPVKKGNDYCYTIEQLREVAIIVTENESNKEIITHQEQLIYDYKAMSVANDSIINKQKDMLINKEALIANSKATAEKLKDMSELEKKALKKEHKAKQKKLRLVVVIQAIIVLAILLIK